MEVGLVKYLQVGCEGQENVEHASEDMPREQGRCLLRMFEKTFPLLKAEGMGPSSS